jgi:acetyl-CoA C-acetyltransferase
MLDPRTPVLVGVGSITHPDGDGAASAEPIELMRRAAEAAALDAGAPDLLRRIGLTLVPKGIWDYPDAAGQLAAALGGREGPIGHTVVGEVGILQQTLITRAGAEIAAGRLDVALVAGGEARRRAVLAARDGREAAMTLVPGAPDELLLPDGEIITAVEIERDLAVPAHQYALVESVLRHLDGISAPEQAERLGTLWAGFARVAAANPHAWDRSGPDASTIATPTADNRMISTPYTKRLCSQWNVDQAAALLLTSVEAAQAAGISPDRWVFLRAGAESQAMVPLPARAEVHRSFGTAIAARAALGSLGITVDDVAHLDLYSCFPAAVQVQARELGIALDAGSTADRPLTVTGGMTFAGGPLNSYVLHSTAAMADVLRADPGSVGMVTSVSGMLTKPAIALWSTDPGADGFAAIDVTDEARAAIATRPVDAAATGSGTVVAHTVVHERGRPVRTVAIVELASGARTVAVDADADRAAAGRTDDRVGEPVTVPEAGVLSMS